MANGPTSSRRRCLISRDLAAPLPADLGVFVQRQDVRAGQLPPGAVHDVVHQILLTGSSAARRQPVGAGDQFDRVRAIAAGTALVLRQHFHPLQDVHAGERAFRGDERLRVRATPGAPTGRPTLSAVSKFSFEHAPGAAMARAALDHRDIGLGQQPQHLGRLLAHVLRARVAGDVQRDAAVERLQARRQPFLAGDVDDVFADVEGRLRQFRDRRIVGHDQRPFELQHQRAGRHQRDDVVALVDPGAERGRDLARADGRPRRGRPAPAAACRSNAG